MRRCYPVRSLLAVAGLLAAWLAVPAAWAAPPDPLPILGGLDARPGQVEAVQKGIAGTDALRADDFEEGLRNLEQAVTLDPSSASIWVNLSAAYIHACAPDAAFVSAMNARFIDPAEGSAAANLQIAMSLECEPTGVEAAGVTAAERAAVEAQIDAEAFVAAAAARRERKEWLVAAFYEERAVAVGAGAVAAKRRIAGDLERAGLLSDAAGVLESTGTDEDAARAAEIRARIEKLSADAAPLGTQIAELAGSTDEEDVEASIRFASILLARGMSVEESERRLRKLAGIGEPQRIVEPWGRIEVPADWGVVEDPDPSAPLLVLRPFPGDGQLAIWGWPRTAKAEAEDAGTEEIDEEIARRLANVAAGRVSEWTQCAAAVAAARCRRARFEIDTGTGGVAVVQIWLLGGRSDADSLLALALPGSAGCGEACREESAAVLADAVARLEVASGYAADDRAALWSLPIPAVWLAPRTYSTQTDTWRTQALGRSLRIDAPPGVVAGRVVGRFRDRHCGPRTRLWLRGSFVDKDGIEVQIGDASYAGFVDVHPGLGGSIGALVQNAASRAPRTDEKAEFRSQADLTRVLAKSETGSAGVVALFDGDAFDGTWMVYFVRVLDDLVEIALPMRSGLRSLDLHWIALGLRHAEQEPPPPPVDIAQKRDIDFRRFEGRNSEVDPREGLLISGPVRVAVPRGFNVSMSAYSRDGYPVTLRSPDEGEILIERLPAGASGAIPTRQVQTDARLERDPSQPWREVKSERGASVVRADYPAAGKRSEETAIIVVPERFDEVPAMRITMTRGADVDDERWDFLTELVEDSIRYRRSREKK